MAEIWREAANLEQLCEAVNDCTLCPLSETRTNVVMGEGDGNADIIFVGEAPGNEEDKQGKPFVGPAGQLLDRLLKTIDLQRNQVYITNTLKCRPPENRDPSPEELKACTPFLFKQIELIRPRIICTLGNHATKILLKTSTGITQLHGKRIRKDNLVYVPLFHPAAALHKPPLRDVIIDDFQKLRGFLEEEKERWEEKGEDLFRLTEEEVLPEQMGLF